jgi:hypothetical protein
MATGTGSAAVSVPAAGALATIGVPPDLVPGFNPARPFTFTYIVTYNARTRPFRMAEHSHVPAAQTWFRRFM